MDIKTELTDLLNLALRMEHSAAAQYLSHAEQITGLYAEPIISRLQDSGADELRHAGVLRNLLGDYLFAVPAMDMTPAQAGGSAIEIIHANISTEQEAITLYKKIHALILSGRADLEDIFEKLEREVRYILMEEQEHVAELRRLVR